MEILLMIAIIILLLVFLLPLKSEINNMRMQIFHLQTKLEVLLEKIKEKPSTNSQSITEDQNDTQSIDTSKVAESVVKEEPDTTEIIEENISNTVYAEEVNILNPIEIENKELEASKNQPVIENKDENIDTKKKVIPSEPNYWVRFKERNPDLEKFIGENLINKIGILILVLGISYFVKYAIDKNWINEPARVGIGVLAGGLILGIAHKLRKKYISFSSVLVAGAIAVFYFIIAIAFHEYQLINQNVAFIIMVLITAFSSLISLSYNRMELAVLALIGGFAVPFMVSSGNYSVLFSYIVILDIGILTLVYFRKWHLVKILAFAFTVLLYGGWLLIEIKEESPHYVGALLFGFVFYFIFVLTNFINNIRTRENFSKVQLIILLLNTTVFYGCGMLILSRYHSEYMGLFTTVLALFNLGFLWVVKKLMTTDKTTIYLLIGLTLTFITLAIPVQFEGNHITLFWAVESVLLIWLSQKSEIKSYRFTAVLIQVLMLLSLFFDWIDFYKHGEIEMIVFNPIFMTGLVVIISLTTTRYLLRHETISLFQFKLELNPIKYKRAIQITAIITGYLAGIFEIGYHSDLYLGSGIHSTYTLPVVYHFLYSAIICFFLNKKKTIVDLKLLNIIAIANICLFTFIFSQLAFIELEENNYFQQTSQIAYYFHFVLLGLVGYFSFLVYDSNKKQPVFQIIDSRYVFLVIAVFVIIIASTEVILEGLRIGSVELTAEQTNNVYSTNTGTSFDVDFKKRTMIRSNIKEVQNKIVKTAIPILWGILAFAFLMFGIKKRIKEVRIIALGLLGVTILKLFTYDISNVSETGKIIAFILLGVLILIISFVYQKIKILVIDEEKSPEINEDN